MKDNYLFLKEVKNLVEKTNCELKVCFQYINRGDRWIQVRSWAGEGMAQGSGKKNWLNVNILAPRHTWEFCHQLTHTHVLRDIHV